MPTSTITKDILLAALAGFQLDKTRIEARIAEVQGLLAGGASPATRPSASPETPTKTRKKRSAAVRKRMAEAQKARWAKIKGEAEPASTPTPVAPKATKKVRAKAKKAAVKKGTRVKKSAAGSTETAA